MSFEDLLKPRPPACKTCDFVASLPAKLQGEVDAAMAKAKYTDASLARALADVSVESSPDAPKEGAIKTHRGHAHRRPQ